MDELQIRFGCTACGKCCTTPPSLRIDELLAQAKHFILGAAVTAMPVYDVKKPAQLRMMQATYPAHDVKNKKTAKALVDHLEKTVARDGFALKKTKMSSKVTYLTLSFVDMRLHRGVCPKRATDGKCTIHENRPLKCRIVPFDESIPEALAGNEADFALATMQLQGYDCKTGSDQPVFWEKGRIKDPETASAWESLTTASTEHIMMAQNVIGEILVSLLGDEDDDIEKVLDAIEFASTTGGSAYSGLVPVLYRLQEDGHITMKQAVEILEDQIRMIQEALPNIKSFMISPLVDGTPLQKVLGDWLETYMFIAMNWSETFEAV